jgi:hypothetical protein
MKKSSLEPLASNPKSLLRVLPGFLARAGPSAVTPTSALPREADWGLQDCPTISLDLSLRVSPILNHTASVTGYCVLPLQMHPSVPGRNFGQAQQAKYSPAGPNSMSQLCLRWIKENLQPIYYTLGTGDTSRSCEQSPMCPQPYLMRRSTKCVRLKAVATTQSEICCPCRLSRFMFISKPPSPFRPSVDGVTELQNGSRRKAIIDGEVGRILSSEALEIWLEEGGPLRGLS